MKQWDFSQNNPAASSLSSVTKPKGFGGLGQDVDPELDGMLAQLEMDEDFMKLSDNEQITWLESLFFLDTSSKKATGKQQFKFLPLALFMWYYIETGIEIGIECLNECLIEGHISI